MGIFQLLLEIFPTTEIGLGVPETQTKVLHLKNKAFLT